MSSTEANRPSMVDILQRTLFVFRPLIFSFVVALLPLSQAGAASLNIVNSSPIATPVNLVAGYPFPNGAYAGYSNADNIALGSSVSVSGTIPGFSAVHSASYLTDGRYGNGSSWIDVSPIQWLLIDLGSVRQFDTISFGRDRLGYFADRNPGQFTISVSSDNSLYTQIFNSADYGFGGSIAAGKTVQASMNIFSAQYIKLQFSSSGAAIDEVEVTKVSAVPLPGAFLLFGSALVGMRVARRKLQA